MPLAATLLMWVAIFLMGYLLAGQRSRWEQKMVQQGAVVHFGLNKVMKYGFEEDMKSLQKVLGTIQAEYQSLPESTAELTEEQIAELAQKRKAIASSLGQTVGIVEQLKVHYGLSADEQQAILALIAQKEAELQGTSPKSEATIDSKTENAKTPAQTKTVAPPGSGNLSKENAASGSGKPNTAAPSATGTAKERSAKSSNGPVKPIPALAEKPSS